MLRLLKTKDNSFTVYNEVLNETYHSRHGAVQESRHVFIRNGLEPMLRSQKQIDILEIGFGTGLNALLSYLEFEKASSDILYTGAEPFPLDTGIISALNYPEALSLNENQSSTYFRMQEGKAIIENIQHSRFQFELIRQEFLQCRFEKQFDLVYFDAFAPDKQPDMWSRDVFTRCHELLRENGMLVTYCAKGEVKRTLKACGFKVETLPGPPGKREMIRAIKIYC
jgi:tRNA U34 5-methylaminomethyl-2-thiouridine-forming methyltransferase MnmC